MQFLAKKLQRTSCAQEDAVVMKTLPHKRADSVAVEWTNYVTYGEAVSGFVSESGSDENYGGDLEDPNFPRQLQKVKYMLTNCRVTVPAMVVNNIEDPMSAAATGGTLRLLARGELALFNEDAILVATQFNSFKTQKQEWLDTYPEVSPMPFDAGSTYIDQKMIEDVAITCQLLCGRGSRFMIGSQVYGDIQNAPFPRTRVLLGNADGGIGLDRDFATTPTGHVRLPPCPTNQPLVADDPGVTGKPRVAAQTSDASTSETLSYDRFEDRKTEVMASVEAYKVNLVDSEQSVRMGWI